MKKLCSVLIFAGFVCLSAWEVVPKFYQTAVSEVAMPLFVASSRAHAQKRVEEADAEKERKIDYRELTKGMDTKGA